MFRSALGIGLHLGVAAAALLVSLAAALDDSAHWATARWVMGAAFMYGLLACRQRLVLSDRGVHVHGMLLMSSIRWDDLRGIDLAPYQPALLNGSAMPFAQQLVFRTNTRRRIEATCCPGSLERMRETQSEVVRRGELLQPHTDRSLAGRHRPEPPLPRPGGPVGVEKMPNN